MYLLEVYGVVMLTPTGYTILGYLAAHARSGYDIRRAADRTPFWGISDGQLYPQLKHLETTGLTEVADDGADDARGKKTWRITDAGREALREWLLSDSAPVATRDENLVKLMFAARADHGAARRLIDERRRHFSSFRRHLEGLVPGESWSPGERDAAAGVPDAIRAYGIEQCDLNLAWCDRVAAMVDEVAA